MSNEYKFLDKIIPIVEQKWGKDTTPVLAVGIVTYNHGLYIRDCLEGVVMQKTNFPVRICIFEDCSTDNTAAIIKEFVDRYPSLFCAFIQSENSWGKPNRNEIRKPYIESVYEATYVALCEGDDYWTDPQKLQKQVDFLIQNPEYAMTFHSSSLLHDQNLILKSAFSKIEDRDYSQTELFTRWIAATASLVYKGEIVNHPTYKAVRKEKDLIFGDNLLIMSSFLSGKVRGMSDNMAVYRKHSEGMSYNVDKALLDKLTKQNILFGKYFPVLKGTLPKIISNRYFTHLKIALKSANIRDTFYFLLKFLKAKSIRNINNLH